MENVLILGNPNSGKTLLFNRLTGMNQKVANFPGVTVEIRSGQSDGLLFQDFPGTYSLKPLTIDERVAIDGFKSAVLNPKTRAVICVLDATRLERSLYLLLQLVDVAKKTHCPLIAAVNVIDEIVGGQIKMDLNGLSNALGCTVVGVSAKKGSGLSQLKKIYKNLPSRNLENIPSEEAINLEQFNSTDEIIRLKSLAHELSKKYGPTNDVLLLSQHRLDNFFLSTWGGPLVFTALMLFLFQSIFSWAAPFMDGIDNLISTTGNFVASNIHSEILADFMKDAVFAICSSNICFVFSHWSFRGFRVFG